MTIKDPWNPEQEKVNRGRRRKTYQTREENKRDDPKKDRTTKTTKSSLSNDQRRFEKEQSEDHREKGLKNKGIRFKWLWGASKNTRNINRNGSEN